MNKKISYITLISDLYMLLVFSYIIYGILFGFERIGSSSFTIENISNNVANLISLIEISFSLLMAYLLHKCNNKKVRIVLLLLCISNILYRIANILALVNPFTIFMLVMNIVLLIILIFNKKSDRKEIK